MVIVRIMMRTVLVIVTTTIRATLTARTHTAQTAPLQPHPLPPPTAHPTSIAARQHDISQPRSPHVQKSRDADNHPRKVGRECYVRRRVRGDYADLNDCAEGLIRDFEAILREIAVSSRCSEQCLRLDV
jgi:hypothetical protein